MIRSPRLRILALALAAVLAVSLTLHAQDDRSHSFLWKVQSGSQVLYLAGSVHALTPEAYPLAPAYQRAFDAAGAIVEEIDLAEADPVAAAPAMLAKGLYQDGRSFSQAVSPTTASRIQAMLSNTPMSFDLIQPMKPWMVMLMIEALELQDAGLDPSLGLDRHFYDLAQNAGKTVIGLETAASQIDRFDRLSDKVQEQLLLSTLDEIKTDRQNLTDLVRAWKNGDTHVLERLLLEGFSSSPEVYTSLIVERNRNWMAQFDACLARPRPCFVIVGAAHVVGPDGLLVMLRQRGYTVEQQ